ncbi:MAG: Fic/DOC family N-terminal domain-containing protein [Bacteroidales bacterium]|nr:Fic/DOC family N-terminal domain-containing protein [Bacteroidales bacterium]
MIEIEKFKAGHLEQNSGYTYFVPNYINDNWTWKTPIINQLLERAAIKLGELNSFSRLVPNIDLFIQLHVTKEAVVSSRIEGTQTKMDEALMPISEVQPEKRNDWQEVNNYIKAINNAITDLGKLPISSRLIKATHKTLLDNVRGEHKMPGEYRTSQNWIGGNSLADAKFIPPQQQLVNDLMGDLEKFLNNDQLNVPALIKIAIAHYQFETIHPFLDGNGRMGRLLITLFLVKEKCLNQPLLYLSTYFEKNKNLYYDNLSNVRLKNDMLQWIKYFLVGIEQTASQAVETLSEIIKYKEEIENNIRSTYGKRSTSAILLLHELFKNPFTNINNATEVCNLTYKAANDLVKSLCKDGYLVEITGQNRNRMYVFEDYLKLFTKTED